MDEQQVLTDLLLQTGPLGTMVIVLGKLIHGWFRKTDEKLELLTKRDDVQAERAAGLELEQRDTKRRLDALERKVGIG